MIEISSTKGYAFIKIRITHNGKNKIDFENIRECYEIDLRELEEDEEGFIKEIQ